MIKLNTGFYEWQKEKKLMKFENYNLFICKQFDKVLCLFSLFNFFMKIKKLENVLDKWFKFKKP